MTYRITEHEDYLRAVIADDASTEDFAALYRELQMRCAHAGYDGALVCATWTLYQACNKAERAATKAGVNVRAFLQEMEAVRWLTG